MRFFQPTEKRPDLEAAAEAMAPSILAGRDENLARFKADHKLDQEGYRFECKRWGDFLTVMIERRSRDGSQKLASSINLARCNRVELVKGREPDLEGVASFWENAGKPCPDLPGLPYERPMIGDELPRPDDSYYTNELYTVVEGVARPAEDDAVAFVGAETVILAPAGVGETVERAIMAELEAGYRGAE